jgi:hypothetical protein
MLAQIPFGQVILFEDYDQLHIQINSVKLTFFSFPFPIPAAPPNNPAGTGMLEPQGPEYWNGGPPPNPTIFPAI